MDTVSSYDGKDRLLSLIHSRQTGNSQGDENGNENDNDDDNNKQQQTIAAYGYVWDAADRLIQFTTPDGTSNYTFDATNQLTAADHSYQPSEGYSYSSSPICARG